MYTLADNECFLFIVIFRDPYDWLRSFHLKPYHAVDKSVSQLDFSTFIRIPWRGHARDKNPRTGLDFENVMKLRSARIEAMLNLKKHVHNIYYVNYEKIRDHPEEVLKEISEIFNIKIKSSFVPVKEYKGVPKWGFYNIKKYKEISDLNLVYINSELNLELEKNIGYQLNSP